MAKQHFEMADRKIWGPSSNSFSTFRLSSSLHDASNLLIARSRLKAPMSLKYCSKLVFRSFRKVERFTDRLTGRAGPVFVGLATILITGCAITFFEVVFPLRFLSNTPLYESIAGTIWCIYLVYTFSFNVSSSTGFLNE